MPQQEQRAMQMCPDAAVSSTPLPQTHCTKRVVEKPISTSAKEKRLKSARSGNFDFLSFRATAEAVSLCNVSFPIKFLLLCKYSWEITCSRVATAELSAEQYCRPMPTCALLPVPMSTSKGFSSYEQARNSLNKPKLH